METVTINRRWCKGCGICAAFCPRGALVLEEEKAVSRDADCIACGLCELMCPELAVLVDQSRKPRKTPKEVRI
ncbi:MAG: 4Fe-4S binding protein [Desulfovibrio sp.]|jgi:2-oxoglutarate ferredoxin oxidoreductase subunit delta|nr:4Fe-4S binding protein [Desulfovibrio sp.]